MSAVLALLLSGALGAQDAERLLTETAAREQQAGLDLWGEGRYADASARLLAAADSERAMRMARRDRLKTEIALLPRDDSQAARLARATATGRLCDDIEWLNDRLAAEDCFRSLAATWRELGDRTAEASVWERLALSAARRGDASLVEQMLDRAAALRPDPAERWRSLTARATAFSRLGGHETAIGLWDDALRELGGLADAQTPQAQVTRLGWEVDTRLNAAALALEQGRYRSALDARRTIGSLTARMRSAAEAGGEWKPLLLDACAVAEARALAFEGTIEELSGSPERARSLYRDALKPGFANSGAAAAVHLRISHLELQSGQIASARAEAAEAIRIRTQLRQQPELLEAMLMAARVELAGNHRERALEIAASVRSAATGAHPALEAEAQLIAPDAAGAVEARRTFAALGLRPAEVRALAILGRLFEEQGKGLQARASYEEAIHIAEQLLSGVTVEEKQKLGQGLIAGVYSRLVQLLHRAGINERALDYSNRAARYALVQHSPAAAAETSALRGYMLEVRRLRSQNPQARFTIEPLNLVRLQAKLAPHEAILLFHPSDGTTHVFAITRSRLQVRESAVGRQELRKQIHLVRELIDGFRKDLTSDDAQLAAEADQHRADLWQDDRTGVHRRWIAPLRDPLVVLHDALIEPVQEFLRQEKIRSLLLVPQGDLFYLPFAALLNRRDGKFLIESFDLSQMTECDLASPAARAPTGGLVAFGNPEGAGLAEAEREIESIRQRFPGSLALRGEQASRKRLFNLRAARYLHFATHGVLDDRDPSASYLMLAGENLGVGDIYDLSLRNVELVVLSACRTALGTASSSGTEVGVFVEAFRQVANSVVATLWSVDDLGTRELMVPLYDGLAEGKQGAPALAAAQRRLLKHPALKHPYFWAPFVHYGRTEHR